MTEFYTKTSGEKLAYVQHKRGGAHVLFIHGLRSDMGGGKAMAVDAWCAQHHHSYTRFDCRGHGASDAGFLDGCIGDWLEDTLDILDHVVGEPCIIIGSSMGGWLALLAALKRPDHVRALIGIAAAPDFTERLIWQQLPEKQRQQMTTDGVIYLPSCSGGEDYPITHKLIDDGRRHLILPPASPDDRPYAGPLNALTLPIRLLHGMADEDVPWQLSCDIAERVASEDVQLRLIKHAGHRMSEPEQLAILTETLADLTSAL